MSEIITVPSDTKIPDDLRRFFDYMDADGKLSLIPKEGITLKRNPVDMPMPKNIVGESWQFKSERGPGGALIVWLAPDVRKIVAILAG